MSTSLNLPAEPSKGELDRAILSLTIPAVIENLLLTAVSFTDTLMVGWLHDPASLAAVAMAGFFNYILSSLFSSLAVSVASLFARSWGKEDYEKARIYFGVGFSLSILAGFLAVLLFFFPAPFILSLMGLEGRALYLGIFYLRVIVLINIVLFPAMIVFSALRGSGNTRTPMFITGLANIVHIILAFFLIFGWGLFPRLELAGAAWSTAIATTLSSIAAIFLAFKGKGEFYLRLSHLQPQKKELRETLSLAAPAFWEALIFRGSQVIFMRFVSALGEIALAAHQIANSIESISYQPGWGFTVASSTLSGQLIGAEQPNLAEKSVHRTLQFGLLTLGACGLIFLTMGDKIAFLFWGTPPVIAQAGLAIRLGGLEQPGLAINMILAGALRGAGDTKSPLWATIAGVVLGRLVLVYFLAFTLGLGLAGVWLGTACDWSLRALLVYLSFRRGNWRKKPKVAF